MGKKAGTLVQCLWRALTDTVNHDGIEHAGYLSFLWLLALFPFLVFVVAVIGAIRPETEIAQYLATLLQQLPPEIIRALEPRILEITSGPPQGLLTLAIVGAVWTASSAVEGLRTILNRAYRVHTPPAYWFRRGLSILQLLVFAFVVIMGVLTLVTLPLFIAQFEAVFGLHVLNTAVLDWAWRLFPLTIMILLGAVCWLYYFIPNARQRWFSVLPGAALVVGLWLAAAQLFTLYLSHFHQVNLIYGSLGGFIVALLFFYICNMIFIFGAEFNYHIGQRYGMKTEEKEEAA